MKVLLARYAGACRGVQRALDLTYQAINVSNNVYTLGELIHNSLVVKDLKHKGVHPVNSIDELQSLSGATVVIRSHGTTPRIKQELADLSFSIVDATCPHVLRAQRAAAAYAKEGFQVVVIGEKGHPEVQGIAACAIDAGANVSIVAGAADISDQITDPVGVVVQTTQRSTVLDEVITALQKRGCNPHVSNTICEATQERQEAAADLAQSVDAVVVIGGKTSSNTARLAEVCKQYCPQTYHIETLAHIKDAWFKGCNVVGVTAGASTPEDQIIPIISYLEQL